jgi:ArsR family transcriptional regulator
MIWQEKKAGADPVSRIAQLFKAIGEENRLRILNLLANRGEICVCDLTEVLGVPQARVSRHLAELRHAGLVTQRRQGPWVHYSLGAPRDGIHASLLQCMRKQFAKIPDLAGDLRAFDRLLRRGKLVGTGRRDNPRRAAARRGAWDSR